MAYKDPDINSICCKYTPIHQKKVPTGNPDYPSKVFLTKRCNAKIREKTELGYGEDSYNMETDDFGGDDEVADGAVEPVGIEEGGHAWSNITT